MWTSRSSCIDYDDFEIRDQSRKLNGVLVIVRDGRVDLTRIGRRVRQRGVDPGRRHLEMRGRPLDVAVERPRQRDDLPDSQPRPLQVGLASDRGIPKLYECELGLS